MRARSVEPERGAPIRKTSRSWTCSTGRSARQGVARRDVRVPARRLLDGPLAGLEVDPHEAEALRVALGPLEVVEQAPGVVAAHVGAVADRLPECAEVAAVELDPPLVAHDAVLVGRVAVGAAVLRH